MAKTKTTRLTVSLPDELATDFKQYCDRRLVKYSNQIQLMIQALLKEDSNGDNKN